MDFCIHEICVVDDLYREGVTWNGRPMGLPEATPEKVAYYLDREAAITAVLENRCDIHDGNNGYDGVIVVTRKPGLYASGEDPIFFAWDKEAGAYKQVERPAIWEHVGL